MAPKGLMKEAIDKEDFDRMEKGLPPRTKVKPKLVAPDPPIVKDQVRLNDLKPKKITDIDAHLKRIKNAEGVTFVGVAVEISAGKESPIVGWMTEADFYSLRREVGSRVDTAKLDF